MKHVLFQPLAAPALLRAGPPIAGKLEELQLLRAIAAGMVVWTHSLDWAEAAGVSVQVSPGVRAIGAAGVDLFFIISGFIITRSAFHSDRRVRAGEFMFRRVLRIVPLYWCWSAIVFAWQTASGNAFAPAQILKTFAFFPWAETEGYVLPVLYLGWTLSYELFFYLAVAIALWVGARRPHALICAGVVLAAFSWSAHSAIAWIPFLASPLWLEFSAGMLLAANYEWLVRLPRWFGIGLMAVGLGWWVAAAGSAPPALADVAATLDNRLSGIRVATWGGGALGLATGAIVAFGTRKKFRSPALFVALGDASYTWYLTQAVTLPLAARIWAEVVGASNAAWYTAFAVAVTGGLGLVLARAIEFPLHRWSLRCARKLFRDRHPAPLDLAPARAPHRT